MSNLKLLIDKISLIYKLGRSKRRIRVKPVEKRVEHKLTKISIGPGPRIRITRELKKEGFIKEDCKKGHKTSIKNLMILFGVILGFVITLRVLDIPVSETIKIIQSLIE